VERQDKYLANSAWNDQPVGRPKIISDQYLRRLRELVISSPRDYGYPFQRWTAQWLKRHLAQETGVEVSDRHINRLLKQMGLSTRPQGQSLGQKSDQLSDRRPSITISDLTPSLQPESLLAIGSRN
jgi:transposase